MTEDQERIKLRDFFAQMPEVSFAYLFGSRAKGKTRPGSDWDVAVWLDADDPYDRLMIRLDIQNALSDLLGQAVDVVDLRSATPLLRNEVIQARGLLWAQDPLSQSKWELQSVAEYLDWLPYHRRHASALLERLAGKDGEAHDQSEADRGSPWDVGPIHR